MKHLLLCASLLLIAACQPEPASPPVTTKAPQTLAPTTTAALDSRELWLDGTHCWATATTAAAELNRSIEELLQEPDHKRLSSARQRWHNSHAATAACLPLTRFSASHSELFAPLKAAWSRIDNYPIAPGYVDAVEGYPHSGVVHDTTLIINHTNLQEQHGLTSDEEATLGLHVLEFLLWGEDGERSFNAFIRAEAQDTLRAVDQPQNRRRDLLKLVGLLLEDELQLVTEQWANPGSVLAAPYFRLPETGRTLLWRQALSTSLNLSDEHCDFSPTPCPILPAIASTVQTLTQQHPALLPEEHWQQSLQLLTQQPATEPPTMDSPK